LFSNQHGVARQDAGDDASITQRHPIAHAGKIETRVSEVSADGGFYLSVESPDEKVFAGCERYASISVVWKFGKITLFQPISSSCI
jgi:hypothetical protein